MMNTEQSNETLSPLQKEILKKWQKKKSGAVAQDFKDTLEIKFDGEVLFEEIMSKHSYIKVGGPAEIFLKPHNKEAIVMAVKLAQEFGVPYYFHGSGANTLIKDSGIRGVVISAYNALNNYEVLEQTDDHIDIRADAGLSFQKLVQVARDLGVADIAPLTGIPGSVGGLVMMNAGTPVREIKDVVRSVTIINKEGEIIEISREKLDFQYRSLKLAKSNFILDATFRLQDLTASEEVANLMKQYQERRVATQPLEYPNLGSIFKNPQPEHKNEVVASAGKLVEEAGLKNIRVGGARISQKHGNFIINEGEATAKDVLALIGMVKDKVKQTTGIVLDTEIKVIGED